MLESFNSEKFDYQRLSPEEQQKRGILGRLVGVIADTVKPTRNGRKYSGALWEKVFEDPIMQERIDNRVCFGELGHPADREETDMEKIAVCLAEQPKKGKDGKLYGVFDILNTPNGKILKTLCEYGCNIGVSSRGSGDLVTDYDGNESVDENTYDCQGFDVVLIPAVKEARLQYVTESLDKVRYNKTLRNKLQESIDRASADDKRVMQESLNSIGINLNEDMNNVDDSISIFNGAVCDCIDYLKENNFSFDEDWEKVISVNAELNGWDDLKKYFLSEAESHADEFSIADELVHIVETNKKDAQTESLLNRLYYAIDFWSRNNDMGTMAELGLEWGDNTTYYPDIKDYSANGSVDKDFEDFTFGIYEDDKQVDTVIGKDYRVNESLDESAESRELANIVYDTLMNNKQFAQFDADAVDDQEIENDSITFTYNGKPYRIDVMAIDESLNESIMPYEEAKEFFASKGLKLDKDTYDAICKMTGVYPEVQDTKAVDNNEAMVEELQKSLKANKELQDKLVELQEKLSVSYAKESKLEEQIDKQKSAISNLTRTATKVVALKEKITTLENNARLLEEKIKDRDNSVSKLNETLKSVREKRSIMQEAISKNNESNKSLKEEMKNLRDENSKLTESLESLKKDFSIKKNEYSNKLTESNKLVEKYKRIAAKSVDKYIDSQAIRLGVNSNEIKNRLPESYTFSDIDNACEDVMQYKVGINKLPFNTMLKEDVHIKATPSKNEKLALNPSIDDDVDEQLMQWARLK